MSDLERVVTEALQKQFAELSGDNNPMHTDAVAARRTQAGLPVVHGIHTLLWALEIAVASGRLSSLPTTVKARFAKWVFVGERTEVEFDKEEDFPSRLKVAVAGVTVLTAVLKYGEVTASPQGHTAQPSPERPRAKASSATLEGLQRLRGVAYTSPDVPAATMFPALCARVGARAVAEIAACSYIVGMEAPGLHSIFVGADLQFLPNPGKERSGLSFQVMGGDVRFRQVLVDVAGTSIAGKLITFFRVPPVEQASIDTLKNHVTPGEFTGVHALIIGGSRGLGELAAKLIAAGGGATTITYAVGKADAETLVTQVREAGGTIDAFRYNVQESAAAQLTALDHSITHMLYFATNTIFRPKMALVNAQFLDTFNQFYLYGFHELCVELVRPGQKYVKAGNTLGVFYPSTVFVEKRPAGMTEYAMSKAAGEVMCDEMNRRMPQLKILASRLPKLLTDQTASVMPQEDHDPIEALLPVLRQLLHPGQSSLKC